MERSGRSNTSEKRLPIYFTGYKCYEYLCSDVDECALGTHDCSNAAVCTNNPGSYQCLCRPYYLGDGKKCFFLGCLEDVTPSCFTCSVTQERTEDGECVSCPDEPDESLTLCFTCPYVGALGGAQVCNNTANSFAAGTVNGKRQTDSVK